MNVADLFQALSVGELRNLSMSLDGSGDIDELRQPEIITYANQALTALHTRFPHKKDYVEIELQADLHKYFLLSEYAVSDTDVANLNPRYIKDTVDQPFDPRIGKILSIMDEDAEYYRDREVLINDQSSDVAVKMIAYNGFYVKEPVAGNIYTVEVQSLHPLLDSTTINDAAEIDLAPVLHEALTSYIAAKVYKAQGTEMSTLTSNGYMATYEEICARAEMDDTLQKSSSNDHDKLREGGWE